MDIHQLDLLYFYMYIYYVIIWVFYIHPKVSPAASTSPLPHGVPPWSRPPAPPRPATDLWQKSSLINKMNMKNRESMGEPWLYSTQVDTSSVLSKSVIQVKR
jgi:hypothetical protein